MSTKAAPTKQVPKKISLSQTVWQKIWALTNGCQVEISGLGVVDEDDPLHGDDLFVPKQVCGPGSTLMDDDAVMKLTADLHAKGVNPKRISLWWHSHCKMDPFWSSTDNDNIERLATDGALLSIVTSQKGTYKARIDIFEPIRHTFHDVDVVVDEIPVITQEWVDEALKRVTKLAPKPVSITKSSYSSMGVWSGNSSYKKWPKQKEVKYDWENSVGYGIPQQKPLDAFEGEEAELPIRPMEFSHPKVQSCYDEGIIDLDEAEEYEKELLLQICNEDSMLTKLNKLEEDYYEELDEEEEEKENKKKTA